MRWRETSTFPNANLLAALDDGFSLPITNDTSVWHDGIDKNSSHEIGIAIPSISENRLTEVSSLETGFTQIGFTQVGSSQVGSTEISLRQIGSSQVGSSQVGSAEISLPQDRVPQIRIAEICSNKAQIINPRITQINFLQASSFQYLSDTTEFNSTEIFLPSSIALQQLLRSHNFSLQGTTVPTWLEFLQEPSPFNLNIEIADLPTGQLAEASITSFDLTATTTSSPQSSIKPATFKASLQPAATTIAISRPETAAIPPPLPSSAP